MIGELKYASPEPTSPLASFRVELFGMMNGFVVNLSGSRSFVVQLGGDTIDDFEDVLSALRDAFKAHRDQLGEK